MHGWITDVKPQIPSMKRDVLSDVVIIICVIVIIVSVFYARHFSGEFDAKDLASEYCATHDLWACNLTGYLNRSMPKYMGVRLPISLKYMVLSQIARSGKTDLSLEEQFHPPFLTDYGVLPEAVMPTDKQFLQNVEHITYADAIKELNENIISSGKDFFKRTTTGEFPDDTVVLYLKQMTSSSDAELVNSATQCLTISSGVRTCYQDEILQDVSQLPAMIIIKGEESGADSGGIKPAVLLGADAEFVKNETDGTKEFKMVYLVVQNEKIMKIEPGEFARRLVAVATNQRAHEISKMFETSLSIDLKSDKPTLLFITLPGCRACGQLVRALGGPDVRPLTEKYRIIKLVEGSADQKIIDNFHPRGFPVLVRVDSQLKEIDRMRGYESKDVTRDFLKRGLK